MWKRALEVLWINTLRVIYMNDRNIGSMTLTDEGIVDAERIRDFPSLQDYKVVRSADPLSFESRYEAMRGDRGEVVAENATFTDRDVAVPIDREYFGIDVPGYRADEGYTAIVEKGHDERTGSSLYEDSGFYFAGGETAGIVVHSDAHEMVEHIPDVNRLYSNLVSKLSELEIVGAENP